MENEIWKNIIGYETKYQVSSYGRIKSLSRIRKTYGKRKYKTKGKLLKKIKKEIGYEQVGLCKNGVSRIFLVHRLVAEHFLLNPLKKPQVNHKDGNKLNNNVENLEWCTSSENGLHAYNILGITSWHKGATGTNTPTGRRTIQKTLNGKIIKIWDCALEAVRNDGFDSSGISRCANGFSKQYRGFIWEYEPKRKTRQKENGKTK